MKSPAAAPLPELALPQGAGPLPALRVLTTFATWCEPCVAELPELRHLRASFPDRDLRLLSVPVDPEDLGARLERWVRRHTPPYRMLEELPRGDVAAIQELLRAELGSEGLPASLVLAADGRVLLARFGAPTVSDLRRLLAVERDE